MLGAAMPFRINFNSGGRRVRVEVFRGSAQAAGGAPGGRVFARQPAVIMLHGAGGVGGGLMIYPQAEALAANGITAFVVDYYDGLSDKIRSKASPALFSQRDQIIEDALNFVASQPYVEPSDIGVYGISLGGFHGLSISAHDERVTALVDVFGALPATMNSSLSRMPPTLIMHGAKDPVVPVARSKWLDRQLDQLGVQHELVVYKNQGHCFYGASLADSIERTTRFFIEHFSKTEDDSDPA
jgi:dienelactone hydrolase